MCLQVLKSVPNTQIHILKGWALTFIIFCVAAVCFLCWNTTSKKSRLLLGLVMVLPLEEVCPAFLLTPYGQPPYDKTFTAAIGSRAVWKNSYSISSISPRWVSAIPVLYGNYFCRDPASQQALFISSISASPGLHTKGCQEWAQVKYSYLIGNSFHANGQLPRKSILYNLRKLNWNNLIGCKFASQTCPRI